MLGLTRFTLLALAFSASALAGPHSRQKRRHQHAERHIEERDAGNSTHALSKRAFNGRGTFYDVGLGACGQYSSPGDYMVALNSDQYGGGYPGPQCFKKITIQCNGVTVGGVTIMDECPTCPYGGLDLSRGLFTRFADESAGVIQLTWWFEGDAPAPDPTTSTWVAPSPAWTPPPSSEAPSPTSTWTPPPSTSTSTWVAPTSTSTWVEPSPSASPSPSSSSTSTWSSISLAPSSSAAASNTTNPFAIVATDNSTSTSTSLSASASASSSAGSSPVNVQSSTQGNLVAINGLVAAYGQLIVTGAGGYE